MTAIGPSRTTASEPTKYSWLRPLLMRPATTMLSPALAPAVTITANDDAITTDVTVRVNLRGAGSRRQPMIVRTTVHTRAMLTSSSSSQKRLGSGFSTTTPCGASAQELTCQSVSEVDWSGFIDQA